MDEIIYLGYTHWSLSCCEKCKKVPNLIIDGGQLTYVMCSADNQMIREYWCKECFDLWKMSTVI